ncbi:hypothetical protein [Xenophilus sp. Marseille-Q4582]|uniref:hypothetical protein n=1 Tax=Xenophilus sp. Marseille-Q4582 TaxID=2866600 RepID=UPI001CE3E0C9|nr:hypothetical protein [Xenophilus sp. Marseille-Q4582]
MATAFDYRSQAFNSIPSVGLMESLANYGTTPINVLTGGTALGNTNLVAPSVVANPLGYAPSPSAMLTAGPSTLGSEAVPSTNWWGYTDQKTGAYSPGIVQQGLGIAQGIGNLYLGMKQYGLQKDIFENNKQQYAQNYAAQRTLTNARLEDRQRARVAANPDAYESVGSYMARNRIV